MKYVHGMAPTAPIELTELIDKFFNVQGPLKIFRGPSISSIIHPNQTLV